MAKTKINDCLKHPAKLGEILSTIESEGAELKDAFVAELETYVKEKCADVNIESLIKDLVKGEEISDETVSDVDLFIKCQEGVLASYGAWDEATAPIAVASYIENGGSFSFQEDKLAEKVTYGELYSLDESHDLFKVESTVSNKQRAELPQGAFGGAERTFPIYNAESALLALKLASDEDTKNFAVEALSEYGFEVGESLSVHPIVIKVNEGQVKSLFPITDNESLTELESNLESILDTFKLSESQKGEVKLFLENVKSNFDFIFTKEATAPLLETERKFSNPLQLGAEFLFEYFVNNELKTESNEDLAKVVGLLRKKLVSKEQVENSAKGYKVFSRSVLERLYSQSLTEAAAEADETEEPPIEVSTSATGITVDSEADQVTEDEVSTYRMLSQDFTKNVKKGRNR